MPRRRSVCFHCRHRDSCGGRLCPILTCTRPPPGARDEAALGALVPHTVSHSRTAGSGRRHPGVIAATTRASQAARSTLCTVRSWQVSDKEPFGARPGLRCVMSCREAAVSKLLRWEEGVRRPKASGQHQLQKTSLSGQLWRQALEPSACLPHRDVRVRAGPPTRRAAWHSVSSVPRAAGP